MEEREEKEVLEENEEEEEEPFTYNCIRRLLPYMESYPQTTLSVPRYNFM